MDADRDELVAALRRKLTELDAQVVAYRRERADEFRRYATDLLKPIPDSVAAEVANLVEGPSASLASEFGALYPGFLDAGDDKSILAPPPPSRAQARRTISPPPVLYHTSGVPKDGPRRPPSPLLHGRDNELQGLFTPHFLPLLDGSSDNPRSPSIAGVYDESVAKSTAQRDADAAAVTAAAASAELTAVKEAAARAAALTPPPPPEQKLKSALRRTSSLSSSRSSTPSIKSPSSNTRHVRFFLGGEEVSPTASPPRPVQQDLSWLMHGNRSQKYDDIDYDNAGIQPGYLPNATSVKDSLPELSAAFSRPAADEPFDSYEPHSHRPKSVAHGWGADDHKTNGTPQGDKSQMSAHNSSTAPLQMSGSDLISVFANGNQSQSQSQGQNQNQSQATIASTNPSSLPFPLTSAKLPQPRRQSSQILDDDEDFSPLSRKISSSDRLRALSKMPLEDPSTWTVVNPQSSPGGSGGNNSPSADEIISTYHQRRSSKQQEQDQMLSLHRSSTPSPPTVELVEDTQDTKQADTPDGYKGSDDDDDDDDEGFIAMRPVRKQSNSQTVPPTEIPRPDIQARSSPPASMPAVNGPATNGLDNGKSADLDPLRPKKSTASGKPVQVQFADSVIGDGKPTAPPAIEDDDLFEFEDEGGLSIGYPLTRSSKVNGDIDGDKDEHSDVEAEFNNEDRTVAADDELVARERTALGIGNDGLDSKTLAYNHRKIIGAAIDDGGIGMSSLSSTPPGPPLGASVGSYRGRNIDLFNVVKDPRVLQEAAQLGDLDSFVGSIHDGHQPSTMAEFSSLSGPQRSNLLSGTPRSLTERMVMEDIRKNLMSSSARHP